MSTNVAFKTEAIFENKQVLAYLDKIVNSAKAVKDRSRAYIGLISILVFQDVMEHFKNEDGSSGIWRPWSKSYTKQMFRRKKVSNGLLKDTGNLRQRFAPAERGGMNRKTTDGLLWFNNAQTKSGFPYAAAHDEGGPKLPQREFMWLSENAMQKIENQTLNFLLDEK